MFRGLILLLIASSLFTVSKSYAKENNTQEFDQIFSSWTKAFNNKDLEGSCNLFSKNLHANYQGAPPKNYQSICDSFKKIFKENRTYKYRYKLHQIYRSNNWASVRVTWYLTISEHGEVISETIDEGLDVFERDKQGRWKIVNYLSYPEGS